MNPETALALAQAVLAVHLAAAGLIVFGLVAIPLGGWLGWAFVHVFWWRLLHVAAMGSVAAQKLLGNACFLSIWERRLTDEAAGVPHPTPLFQSFGEHVLYWNLPLSFFVWLYSALFVFIVALWFAVPPSRPRS